jgi:hypothetical protein
MPTTCDDIFTQDTRGAYRTLRTSHNSFYLIRCMTCTNHRLSQHRESRRECPSHGYRETQDWCDGGIDCITFDPHPITGGKFIIQTKLYTRTVAPTHVRDLWGTVQHECATKGIMITTSGYGPDSYKFAAGKPINLIDGSGLLSICQEHGIPARILKPHMRES